jgi:hypothetical protein
MLFSIALIFLTVPKYLWSYQAEKTVIIIIEGIRAKEAHEDPIHRYMPHLWFDIVQKGKGSFFTSMLNSGRTSDYSGLQYLVTGMYKEVEVITGYKPFYPTIFEYFRKGRGASKRDAVLVSSRIDGPGTGINYSTHPFYGPEYTFQEAMAESRKDTEVYALFTAVIDSLEPDLIGVYFQSPDVAAQYVSMERYYRSVTIVDSLIYSAFQLIQEHPSYKDNTTFVVTSIHGRHDDEIPDGPEWHGCHCHGCRTLFTLFYGPDIKNGTIIETRHDIFDICPTIGELCGIATPFTQGQPLWGIFRNAGVDGSVARPYHSDTSRDDPPPKNGDAVRISDATVAARDPYIVRSNSGFHITWMDKDETLPGGWDILHAFGANPSDSVTVDTLFHAQESTLPYLVRLAGEDDDHIQLFLSGTEETSSPSGPSLSWFFHGSSLQNMKPFLHRKTEWTIERPFSVDASGSCYAFAYCLSSDGFIAGVSDDYGQTWTTSHETVPGPWWRDPSACDVKVARNRDESAVHMIFKIWTFWDNDLFYILLNGSSDFKPVRINDERDFRIFHPTLAETEGALHAAWADYREGTWKIYYSSSTDGGETWSANVPIAQGARGALKPLLLQADDLLILVWENYGDDSSDIFLRCSDDGGTHWGSGRNVSNTPGISCFPHAVMHDRNCHIVWQDNTSDGWQIYCKKEDLSSNRLHVPPVRYNVVDSGVLFTWDTTRNRELHTVLLSRKSAGDSAFVPVEDSSTNFCNGTILDRTIATGTRYIYRLTFFGRHDLKGDSDPIYVTIPPAANRSVVSLHPVAPNPFNPVTQIRFSIHGDHSTLFPVKVSVYNSRGELVDRLFEGMLGCGDHSFRWCGGEEESKKAASGIYYAKVRVGDQECLGKMLLLK